MKYSNFLMNTIVKIHCKDEIGLVYKITGVLFNQNVNVLQTNEFVLSEQNQFFMRVLFSGNYNREVVEFELNQILPSNSKIEFVSDEPKKVVILATKEHHCLGDLLIKNKFNDLSFDIQAVISNHNHLHELTQQFNIPFHLVSSDEIEDRELHEREVMKIIDQYSPEIIVLAKYMRILTPKFTKKYFGRLINIHHSFLPAFIGARPYHQAYERGVKIIGATAHFVTDDLDEGPIICQEILPVSHSYSAKAMAKAGKEVEKLALSKALQLVFENRVFVYKNKTILFE